MQRQLSYWIEILKNSVIDCRSSSFLAFLCQRYIREPASTMCVEWSQQASGKSGQISKRERMQES